MPDRYVAEYLRISDDDEDIGGKKLESESIGNQRKVLEDYRKNHEKLAGLPVKEFLDDGFSGVNFNRPGVQRLLKEVRENRIACILVKDLSRFGRNYIEAGDYIEQIFPFMGVRFISVSDHYDSFQSPIGIEIGFKNLIHDLYSRDLSRKVKSVKELYQKQGRYSGGDVPYGYQKDDGRGVLYSPDPEAAEIVRKIFHLSADGITPIKIAGILSSESVPTPGAYKNQRTKQNYILRNQKSNLWTSTQVREILQNEVYIGTYVCHKLTSIKPREMRRNDRSEYRKIEKHHEPLVDQELFQAAQGAIQLRGKRKIYRKEEDPHMLKGKVKCGCCGYGMLRRGKHVDIYYCHMGDACGSHMKIQTCILEKAVTDIWRKMQEVIREEFKEHDNKKRQGIMELSRIREEKRLLEIRSGYCRTGRLELYHQWKEEQITKEEYALKREEFMKQETECRKKLADLETGMLDKESDGNRSVLTVTEDADSMFLALTREMVDRLIERIEVYGEDRIEIIWRFRDIT